ncbi:hypothetical protein DICPUDRAFT_15088, partial [Dictyostelium purpureum]
RYDNVQPQPQPQSQSQPQPTSSLGYDNVGKNQLNINNSDGGSNKELTSRYDNVSTSNRSIGESNDSTSSRYDNVSNSLLVDSLSSSTGAVNNTSSSSSSLLSSNNYSSSPYNSYNAQTSNNKGEETSNSTTTKKDYIERDIGEEDLCLLENLIRYKSRLGKEDEHEIHVPNKLLEKSEQNEEPGSGYVEEEEDNLLSNPYISNHSTFTSSYSHPKFLTNKGLTEGFSSRTIVQSSASAISNASSSKIRLENISITSWNSEFQRLLEMDDCLEKFERLSSLEHDFVYAAETYGRIIISENFLSNELKTIKPVSVGGIAGGEKYIVQGILFKFALENETFGLYGSDENAMKTAAHELNGCTSFLNCGIKGLHVPLMAYIDYRGFRLMAMSLLPISKKSLIYGSCDAGQTVHTSNNIFNHLFGNASKIVNLKSHMVQDSSGDIKSIYGPIDIEGHIGADNRFYLLDFARLSPPEPVRHRGSYLYKLLRLELVRKFHKPLCSDAFSPMANIEIDIHNSEVKECYDELINIIIPNFAFNLENTYLKNESFSTTINTDHYFNHYKNISKHFHLEGINLRYLGEVRSYVRSDILKDFLTAEAIVRTLKSLARELLRREMKKTHLPSDYPYRNLLLNFLNLVFDEYTGQTEVFWTKIVFEKMQKKFLNIFHNRGLGEFETAEDGSKNVLGPDSPDEILKEMLENKSIRYKILTKFCKSIGLVLSKVSKAQFKESPKSFVFVDPDIIEIKTLITRLNIIDYADGMSLYYKSMGRGLSHSSKTRLLTISQTRLEESLHSMSTNYNSIFQMGNVIRLIAKYQEYNDKAKKYLEADKTFQQLENLRIDQNLLLQSKIHRVKSNISYLLYERITPEHLERIEALIKDCIELSPSKAYPTYLLAKLYTRMNSYSKSDFEKVNQAYEDIFLIDENYQKGHVNYAVFLLNTQEKNPIFSTEKVSAEIVKALSHGIVDSIIEKIEPVVNYNPWVVYESSKNIPKIKIMVKKAFATMVEKKGKLIIPNNISVLPEDRYFFENIQLSTLHLKEHSSSDNIKVLFSVFPSANKLYLRESNVDNIPNLFSDIKFCSNLTHINFGYSKGILDDYLVTIITPNLIKLKLYEIQEITQVTINKITEVAENLQVLDIGGCTGIESSCVLALLEKNKKIKKIAFPPSIDNDTLIQIFNISSQLERIDYMKCNLLTKDSFSQSFKYLPNLVKFRDPVGVPYFFLAQQFFNTRISKGGFEPVIRYFSKYNGKDIELFHIKTSFSMSAHDNKEYILWFNNFHPLVRFRDPPNSSNGLFQAARAVYSERPHNTLTVYRKSNPNSFFNTNDFIITCFNSMSPLQSFTFDYLNSKYSFSLNHLTSVQGKTFQTNIGLNSKTILTLGNSKSMGMMLDIEVKDKITPIFI